MPSTGLLWVSVTSLGRTAVCVFSYKGSIILATSTVNFRQLEPAGVVVSTFFMTSGPGL